jgi:hypothetical protein
MQNHSRRLSWLIRVVAKAVMLESPSYGNATAKAASATGNDHAQSLSNKTAVAPTTHPPQKPMRRWTEPVNRSVSPAINGWVRDRMSSADSTAFVKLPVMTAVEGATGIVKRKRANCHAMAETATIAVMPANKPCGLSDGLVMTLRINTQVSSRK